MGRGTRLDINREPHAIGEIRDRPKQAIRDRDSGGRATVLEAPESGAAQRDRRRIAAADQVVECHSVKGDCRLVSDQADVSTSQICIGKRHRGGIQLNQPGSRDHSCRRHRLTSDGEASQSHANDQGILRHTGRDRARDLQRIRTRVEGHFTRKRCGIKDVAPRTSSELDSRETSERRIQAITRCDPIMKQCDEGHIFPNGKRVGTATPLEPARPSPPAHVEDVVANPSDEIHHFDAVECIASDQSDLLPLRAGDGHGECRIRQHHVGVTALEERVDAAAADNGVEASSTAQQIVVGIAADEIVKLRADDVAESVDRFKTGGQARGEINPDANGKGGVVECVVYRSGSQMLNATKGDIGDGAAACRPDRPRHAAARADECVSARHTIDRAAEDHRDRLHAAGAGGGAGAEIDCHSEC